MPHLRIELLLLLVAGVAACGEKRDAAPSPSPTKPAKRTEIVLAVDLDIAIVEHADNLQREIEGMLSDAKIAATVTAAPSKPGALAIAPTEIAKREEIVQTLRADHGDVLERQPCTPPEPDTSICASLVSTVAAGVRSAAFESAVTTVRERLVAGNRGEPRVSARGRRSWSRSIRTCSRHSRR